MNKVTKIIVNESEGKKSEQYVVKDINPNFENLTATANTFADPDNKAIYIKTEVIYNLVIYMMVVEVLLHKDVLIEH